MKENLDAPRQRRVTMPDGRYMIFYTFGKDVAPARADNALEALSADTPPAPAAQNEATEEANV